MNQETQQQQPFDPNAPAATDDGAALFEDSEEGLVVNLTGVDENQTYPVMPRGLYPCIIDDVTYGLSQNGGNPMWTLQLEVEEGEFAGQRLWSYVTFTEKNAPRCRKFLVRVAPELLQGPFKPEEVADQGLLVGKRCQARVDIRRYQGQNRNNVRDILPPKQEGAASFL